MSSRSIEIPYQANVSRSLKSLVTIGFVLIAISACDTRSEEARIADTLELAHLYVESDRFEEAKAELQSVIEVDRRNKQALRSLSEIAEQEKDGDALITYLRMLVRLEPADYALKLKLGTIYLLAGQLDEAIDMATQAKALGDYDKEGFVLYTTVSGRLGYLDQMFDAAREFLVIEPNDADALALLIREQIELSNADQALKLANEALEIHPLDIQLNTIKAYLFLEEGKLDEPASIFELLVKEYPTNVNVHRELARVYVLQEKPAEAQALMAQLADGENATELQHFAEIDFLIQTDKQEVAIARLQKWSEENPESNAYRVKLAQLYQALGQIDQSRPLYQQVVDTEQQKDTEVYRAAATSLAGLMLAEGNTETAAELVKNVLSTDARYTGALLIRAGVAESGGDIASAIADLEVIVTITPEDIQARQYLAQLYYQSAKYSDALTHFRYLETNSGLPKSSLLGYGNTLIALGFADQAYQLLSSPFMQGERSPAFMDVYVWSAMLAGELDSAIEGLQYLISVNDENPRLYEALARAHEQKQELQQASDALEKAFVLDAVNEDLADKLARSYVAGNRIAEGIGFFQTQISLVEETEAGGDKKSSIAPIVALANLHALNNELDLAENLFSENQKHHPANVRSYIPWAIAHIRAENNDNAHSILERGIAAVEDQIPLLMVKAQLFEREENYSDAMKSYQQILTRDNTTVLAANNFAYLAISQDGSKEALASAKAYMPVLEQSDSPAIQDTLAWLHYRLGDYDSAYRHALNATRDNIEVPEAHYHLGMIQLKRNNEISAKRAFRRALNIESSYEPAKKELAALEAADEQLTKQIREAQQEREAEAARMIEQARLEEAARETTK